MYIVEHVSLLNVGASPLYIPGSGIAGSSGTTMSNFLSSHQTDFQSGCATLFFFFFFGFLRKGFYV
nr:pro-1 protein [Mus musculus]